MALFSKSVLTQLYEDAPFWWYLKDQAITSPQHNASSIAELDNRLNAMLTMLAQADSCGHNPAEHIALDERGGVFAHCWLGLHQQKENIWQPPNKPIMNICKKKLWLSVVNAIRKRSHMSLICLIPMLR